MELSKTELAAILKAGKTIAVADGNLEEKELLILFNEFVHFNVPKSEVSIILDMADEMDVPTMFYVLSKLSPIEKEYACGYLATIIAADGNIDDSEMEVWRIISTLCSFPAMTIKDALKIWAMRNI